MRAVSFFQQSMNWRCCSLKLPLYVVESCLLSNVGVYISPALWNSSLILPCCLLNSAHGIFWTVFNSYYIHQCYLLLFKLMVLVIIFHVLFSQFFSVLPAVPEFVLHIVFSFPRICFCCSNICLSFSISLCLILIWYSFSSCLDFLVLISVSFLVFHVVF